MCSLPSPIVRPLYLSSSSSRSLCLFSSTLLPKSILPTLATNPKTTSASSRFNLLIRNCSSISAKPSSELRRQKGSSSDSSSDEKLKALRGLFVKPEIGIDAYVIPSQDAHQVLQKLNKFIFFELKFCFFCWFWIDCWRDFHCFKSEFIAECYMRRGFISGFTGSAGTAVVTKDQAALWTDGRYFLQVCGKI